MNTIENRMILVARKEHSFRSTAIYTAACLVALAPSCALAQTAASVADDGSIVVTALRRASTVQQTPMAITALSGATLANTGTRTPSPAPPREPTG